VITLPKGVVFCLVKGFLANQERLFEVPSASEFQIASSSRLPRLAHPNAAACIFLEENSVPCVS
jgi:hypothetical protein